MLFLKLNYFPNGEALSLQSSIHFTTSRFISILRQCHSCSPFISHPPQKLIETNRNEKVKWTRYRRTEEMKLFFHALHNHTIFRCNSTFFSCHLHTTPLTLLPCYCCWWNTSNCWEVWGRGGERRQNKVFQSPIDRVAKRNKRRRKSGREWENFRNWNFMVLSFTVHFPIYVLTLYEEYFSSSFHCLLMLAFSLHFVSISGYVSYWFLVLCVWVRLTLWQSTRSFSFVSEKIQK